MLIYNLVLFPLINSIFNLDTNKIYSNYVYSKTIPIQKAYQMPDATIYKSIIQKDASLTEVSDVTNEQPEQKQEESKKSRCKQTYSKRCDKKKIKILNGEFKFQK